MNTTVRTPNRLIHEKSPYLLQHAHNPVDWYPWGDEAFAKARREEKPIFLSIGYSTCHWCHVMERESFEDVEVAALLNAHFVAVKVDREERPDVDQVYMEVCQALTGRGGWPLTVLLTPEKEPFFAGTYFPKRSRGGHLGLLDLLQRVAEGWEAEQERFRGAGAEIARRLTASHPPAPAGELEVETLTEGFAELDATFDPVYGGFGPPPKFPLPHQLLFLLRYAHRTGEPRPREMALKTLTAMRRGGLWDHLGFGFARYSTDRRWLVPHFEKMLYDNALLALAYLEACQATGESSWGRVAENIFTYVLREMTSPDGAFYSAQDADSEGVEGKFYVWTPAEVEAVLGEELGRLFTRVYDIAPQGNFEEKSIPNLIKRDLPGWAETLGVPEAELSARLEEGRERLRVAREDRVHPHQDDKVLTAWNGLMIAALARGAAVLARPDLASTAEKAAASLEAHLRRSDGRLLARYRAGEAAYPAYLDDYAFLAWGYVELYQATLRPAHLGRALHLVDEALDLFWDEEDGGCFFTGRDAERLFSRPKEVYDGALPSGNSVLALVLQRLAHLTGSDRLAVLAERQLEAFSGTVASHPSAYALFLLALDWALGPTTEVVVAGFRGDALAENLLEAVQQRYLPRTTLLFRPTGDEAGEVESLAPRSVGHEPMEGRATAWVCRERACQAPVQTVEALRELLAANRSSVEHLVEVPAPPS